MKSTHRTGQAVGLWLAEGDKQTKREITFTNNQPILVSLFHEVISENLRLRNAPRIAVYLPSPSTSFTRPVEEARYLVYLDTRANRPYYIYRVSGVDAVGEWRRIVAGTCAQVSNYGAILQGFFAGEGNVKAGSGRSRAIRISQGRPNRFIEEILIHFGVTFAYGDHRMYTIRGRENLERVRELEITVLHPSKHERFLKMMATYRQRHYSKHVLSGLVLAQLHIPQTTRGLALKLVRSESRLRQVLRALKSSGDIRMYHVNSNCYWVRTDTKVVVISKQKMKVLESLETKRRIFELAAELGRDDKSVLRRLLELKRLGLVKLQKPFWIRITPKFLVVVK